MLLDDSILALVGGQMSVRVLTIINYHLLSKKIVPFDQGFTVLQLNPLPLNYTDGLTIEILYCRVGGWGM